MRMFALAAALAAAVIPAQEVPRPVPPLLGDCFEPTSALSREHQYHASVAGVVVDDAGAPVAGATVVVLAYQPFYWALPLGRAQTDAQGRYRLDDLCGAGRPRLWVVTPPTVPLHAESFPLTLLSGQHTKLRPIALAKAAGGVPAGTSFSGKVLAADGTPVAGALVRVFAEEADFDPSTYASTGADGAFSIPVRRGTPQHAQVLVGRCKVDIDHKAGVDELTKDGRDWQLDLTKVCLLRCPDLVTVPCRAEDVDGAELAWSLGGGFVPCAGGMVPTLKNDYGPVSVLVRATVANHLAQVGHLPGEHLSFADDVPMQLEVVDDTGAPLADATVDVCMDAPGQRFEEPVLQTLRTDVAGRLRLLGPKDASFVVYAYADGCEPARGRWSGGGRLQLRRRTARLHCVLDDDESTLYVRVAGTFDCAAMLYPRRGEVDVAVAPGRYEVTRYRSGPVAGAAAVTVTGAATAAVDLAQDQRPTLTVTVPDLEPADKWWAYGSRGALGGMVSHRAMYTTRGGPMPRRALVAEVEQPEPRRFLLRLPISGRWTLSLGHPQIGGRCFREVEVAFGTDYAIALPPAAGKLKGHIAAFPELWSNDFGMDGVAGPRLCLEPAGDTPFGLLVALPEPQDFVLAAVPPGRFWLQHHLYETGMLRSDAGTWGGAALEVAAGATADAGTLQRGPDGKLQVKVRVHGGGAPAGTLCVRDRMYDSWQQVVDENSTLIYASDPIPQPPSARLVDGAASLARLRAGQVQFALELDDGGTWLFARAVDPAKTLEVELPTAR